MVRILYVFGPSLGAELERPYAQTQKEMNWQPVFLVP